LSIYWPALARNYDISPDIPVPGLERAVLITTLIVVLTWINIRGIKQSSWVVNTLTVGKLAPLVLFIVAGIWFISPSRFGPLPPLAAQQIGTAALLLIFAYGGYEVTGVPAGEAANPHRDVPFAFMTTILIVMVVMVLTSIVATGLLPDVGATRTPLADGAAIVLGAAGALIVTVGSAVSMVGNNMGQVLTGSRTIFALAENGDLPRWFAKVHPRYRTPSNSILFTAGVALTLALTGSFVQLAAVSAVARLVMYFAVCTATLVLRRRPASAEMREATFVIPGGPIIPILASAISLGILFGATDVQRWRGVQALAAGAVLYSIARRTVK
jgi:amino acid transporter